MNIREMIEERRIASNKRRAEKLGRLKSKREKLEGSARLIDYEQEEKARIKAARETIKDRGVFRKSARAAKAGKNYYEKNIKGKIKLKEGVSLGGRKDFWK